MEEIAFNDWPGQPVDLNSGGNSWLPAYGFQTPSALLEREDFLGNPDADYFLHGNSTPCLYLETIHEETSDDLRSDSDISDVRTSPLGWLATDSETDSVICMDATNDTDCESDREIACPVKRRRQENLLSLPTEDDYQSLSRSSSLLQFETLEKQCQETSSSSPSIYSQFSLDSLENQRKTTEGNQNKNNSGSDSSDTGDSETTLAPSKSCTNLKSWHSFDSLPFSNSNNNNNNSNSNKSTREKISAENLSEDSGYSDHMCNNKGNKLRRNSFDPNWAESEASKKKTAKSPCFGAYDYCEVFQKISGNFGASCQNLSVFEDGYIADWMRTTNVNLEKSSPTLECRMSKYNCMSASEPNLLLLRDNHSSHRNQQGYAVSKNNYFEQSVCACSVPKNLDLFGKSIEDDTKKTSIAAKNWDLADFTATFKKVEIVDMASFKREGSYAEAMTNRVDLSDDEQSLCYKKKLPRTPIVEFDKKVLHAISESIHSINSSSIADAYLNNIYSPTPMIKGQNRRDVASTPNLVMTLREQEKFIDMLLEDERRRSVQDIPRDLPRKSSLVNHSTSTSCVSDADDKILICEAGSSKGVHFSPVVSEVNWHDDSHSQSTPSTIERESSFSLSSTPERESLNTLTQALLEPRHPTPPPQRFSGSQPELNQHSQVGRFRSNYSQSQPDVSKMRRRGSQLIKKDGDGCIIKAYIDGDGIQYKHTHLDLDNVYGGPEPVPPLGKSHVAVGCNVQVKRSDAVAGMEAVDVPRKEQHHQQQQQQQPTKTPRTSGKLGGFFSRLTSFRFSTRKDDKNKAKKKQGDKKTDVVVQSQQKIATKEDYIYIPLKGPSPGETSASSPTSTTTNNNNNNNTQHHHLHNKDSVISKPPLPRIPPRVVGASVKRGKNAQDRHTTDQEHQRRRRTIDSGESCPRPMEPMGLIETDLDTEVTVITSGPNVKTRSLLNLGAEPRLGGLLTTNTGHDGDGTQSHGKFPTARPHKSMEFLLDKQNLKVVEPPENELQKGERVMSEHQLRVQRSLQKLTVPEWYKQSQIPREGFLLKKHSNRESRWTGTAGSKTTSLSSLGSSNHSPVILSPTSSTQPFIRWSTSKLNSTASSPCASTRSSFNTRQPNGSISPSSVRSSFSYRQPYLGWRSQERLNKPRTPAERLANSLLSQTNQTQTHNVQESPEIQTSIKEVTSAIVHYVSGLKPDSGDDTGSQRSRSVSPRGSQKLCWLESSFVGIRPLDSPQTPVTLTESQTPAPPTTLRLDLQTHNDVKLLNTGSGPKPSPGSTTLEDVLDSLLGLPSSDRAPSPSLQVTASANTSPNRLSDDTCRMTEQFRRRSEGSEPTPLNSNSRRVSFQSSPVLQCRYSRCARIVVASSAEAAAFKNCHNCSYTYCSRACRRAHWEKHRKTCLFSRIGTLCRQVIAAIKEQKDTLYHLSLIARRGYLSHGPGAVKCFFPCPENAEKFLSGGLNCLGELTYVRWPDLLPSEMGPQLYAELVQMCKSYNADSKLVLYVSVCVVSETPATGAVKWERQLVSRCAKMRLSKDICIPEKEQDNPETLILTCNSIEAISEDKAKELKEISINNVQKQLRLRGVSLRRQHPVIFKQLCAYANGSCEKFTPITVYPKDVTTGKSFMCIIMLEADPDSLRQVELAGVKVRTVDVLCAD